MRGWNDGRETLRIEPLANAEHCKLPEDALEALGVDVGQQVRLRRGDRGALYTVVGTAEDVVTSESGAERLGGEGPVAVDATVLTDPIDRVRGTFRETLTIGGDHLVAVAPHGGEMEPWTCEQAELLADRTGGTAWVCRGRAAEVGAFFQWHVTANDLHPASFPRLGEIADRGFDVAVAFHAWRREGIGVGGRAPRALRVAVRDAIREAVGDGVGVELVTDDRYSGDDPDNLVNWLTADGDSGIQLEQGLAARRDYREAVVDAVASVLDQVIR